jgi:hypothetical protein
MINLIPPEGHAAVRLEYRLRVTATLALLFAGVAVLLGIALIPTYVLTSAQITALELETAQNGKKVAFEKAEETVRTTNAILTRLNALPHGILLSSIIDEVQKSTPASIQLKTFYIRTLTDGKIDIQIQGVAPTRSALAQLKNAIESDAMFLHAEVPIADLARDSDLPFAITITLKEKT